MKMVLVPFFSYPCFSDANQPMLIYRLFLLCEDGIRSIGNFAQTGSNTHENKASHLCSGFFTGNLGSCASLERLCKKFDGARRVRIYGAWWRDVHGARRWSVYGARRWSVYGARRWSVHGARRWSVYGARRWSVYGARRWQIAGQPERSQSKHYAALPLRPIGASDIQGLQLIWPTPYRLCRNSQGGTGAASRHRPACTCLASISAAE